MKSQSCVRKQQAAALLIVLAFVVILTALAVAYLSRTTTDRTVAHSSFKVSTANQLAESATNIVIGDLRQEIVNGSTAVAISPAPSAGPFAVYVQTQNAYMMPARSGNPSGSPDPIPNLVRRSVNNDPLANNPGLGSRASAVNSTTDSSANGRYVTLARWNKHYLIPRHDQSDTPTDTTPISPVASPLGPGDATGFTPPDWVIVQRSGPAAVTWSSTLANSTPGNDNYVVGRYAYAVYEEGGVVDVNVAGYPNPSSTPSTYVTDVGRKGVLAFADLTALPTSAASPAPTFPPEGVNSIVGWRNFATTQQPSSSPFPNNFSFTATTTALYDQYVLNNTNGFMTVSSSVWSKPGSNPNPRTDQIFVNRQQLLNFRNSTGAPPFSQNALQYMGTFSRETTASGPQWSPTVPSVVNPSFQTLWVTGSFTRNDGTTANPGEYLVKKRFLLQRLNWLTYRGPSGPSVANPTGRAVTDPDIAILLNNGITSAFLQQGTDTNILNYFGLAWDSTNQRWNYVGHSGGTLPISSIATFGVGGTQAATREPDFFELLQAGIITPSSVDDDNYSPDPTLLPLDHQRSKMLHIITVGANVIAQSRADSYPVRIACTVAGTIMEGLGATRLPYLSSLAACPLAGTSTTNGGVNWLIVPNLWDPFRDSWDLAERNVSSTLTPNYPRPPVRITVSGSVGLGSVVASTSVKTGAIPSVSVTPFPSPSPGFPIPAQSIVLSTPTATPGRGRNGFVQPARIDTTDCTPTPTPFATTTSVSPTPVAQWNNVAYPAPTPSPTPLGQNVVFRISFPGTYIPATATTPAQNPVLILKPGFQMTLEYQSPNGTWYPYSFLQGNNATNTWISASNAANPNLNLTTTFSVYGRASPSSTPTVLTASGATPTAWNVSALAQAPMFAKADPRSIRYNSQIGVLNLSPTPAPLAAGIVGSIWPNGYATPPPMLLASSPSPTPTPSATPTPTVTPTPTPSATPNFPNPATLGDNVLAGSAGNPYDQLNGDGWRPVMMNRPFRSVGEMGYAFRDQPFKTLDFSSATSPDAGLLDLFSVNDYSDPSSMRAGTVSLNSRQGPALAAVLASTIKREDTPRVSVNSLPSPTPQVLTSTEANNIATSLAANATPVTNKADIAKLIANETGLGPGVPKTQRELIARALGETSQTRTWNLMIDVIAQSGRYPQNAASGPNTTNPLANFLVEGEQRYWVHVAIDRFTGQVIDKQIEVVNE